MKHRGVNVSSRDSNDVLSAIACATPEETFLATAKSKSAVKIRVEARVPAPEREGVPASERPVAATLPPQSAHRNPSIRATRYLRPINANPFHGEQQSTACAAPNMPTDE